jgi:hypothetical protein
MGWSGGPWGARGAMEGKGAIGAISVHVSHLLFLVGYVMGEARGAMGFHGAHGGPWWITGTGVYTRGREDGGACGAWGPKGEGNHGKSRLSTGIP